MPLSRQTVAAVVRWGVKYAPVAYAGLRAGRAPVTQPAWRAAPQDPREDAAEHATHLIEGSVLPVFHGDQRVWVVFSGTTPVASHPTVRVPLETLLEHYDLTKRRRPDQLSASSGPRRRTPLRLRQLAARRRSEHS